MLRLLLVVLLFVLSLATIVPERTWIPPGTWEAPRSDSHVAGPRLVYGPTLDPDGVRLA